MHYEGIRVSSQSRTSQSRSRSQSQSRSRSHSNSRSSSLDGGRFSNSIENPAMILDSSKYPIPITVSIAY